jgi:hypothetical protein
MPEVLEQSPAFFHSGTTDSEDCSEEVSFSSGALPMATKGALESVRLSFAFSPERG